MVQTLKQKQKIMFLLCKLSELNIILEWEKQLLSFPNLNENDKNKIILIKNITLECKFCMNYLT